jgi:hypothetical protein
MKKGKFRVLSDGMLSFWCKGCNCYHAIPIDSNKTHSWTFNGNYDKPTISPSILVKTGRYRSEHTGDCWCTYYQKHPDEEQDFKCSVCHSFITDGKIQYLSDCTHNLVGQTIELEEDEGED